MKQDVAAQVEDDSHRKLHTGLSGRPRLPTVSTSFTKMAENSRWAPALPRHWREEESGSFKIWLGVGLRDKKYIGNSRNLTGVGSPLVVGPPSPLVVGPPPPGGGSVYTWKGLLHDPGLWVGYLGITPHCVGPAGGHRGRTLLHTETNFYKQYEYVHNTLHTRKQTEKKKKHYLSQYNMIKMAWGKKFKDFKYLGSLRITNQI